ncbi:ABC transporter ATP-binding protein [Rhodoplanes sp. TEM]|uniref:ABC transporter ATP-binding protein n=1 Tax=Rhodoplanes tepidamans TaxID=200616 RepID=A0ABT5JCY9_RHOTP|nr:MULTISPECIES: ABC transporter ATP-binding protein [Rhodoplanes]MDC7787560.1 ABC transporter ATP-binding protein [Rhodoplanes tepidamans]MDC7984947.1 ABC transporter ATP-binding protein [Rhodoplanes sp. TEM]MDQ0357989.1 branched-chain amino acid transport system ATP-binding protein [Rhodoplanes tepidamans]
MLSVAGLTADIGRIPVLKGVSISVAPGETVALLGRNGVGKTSTLRAVLGLLRRTGGSVSYQGQDLGGLAPHRLAALGLGYVPQGRGIFPLLTVEDNLCLGLKGKPPADLFAELYERFPRLAERRRQAAGTLSGGEQQILAIARCLIMRPSLIMLDEPTEGIMPKLVSQIRTEIAAIAKRGIAVLIVEQNLRTALRLADRVYLMERGQVVHEATPAALRETPDTVHRYLGVAL